MTPNGKAEGGGKNKEASPLSGGGEKTKRQVSRNMKKGTTTATRAGTADPGNKKTDENSVTGASETKFTFS